MGAVRVAVLIPMAVALLCGYGARAAPQSASADGDWTMPSKDYAATRYSTLAGINAQNAGSLHPVWTFSTGVLGGHEGQPLVVGDTMIRYTQIGAGASWEAEYGDPARPADRAWILSYSPYQNVSPGRKYPPVLFVTATSDDRVTPVHARKMAARMYWLGLKPGDVHLNLSSPGWAKHAWSSLFAPWNAQATILAYHYERFDACALLTKLVQCGVTSFCAPPTVWRMSDKAAINPAVWRVIEDFEVRARRDDELWRSLPEEQLRARLDEFLLPVGRAAATLMQRSR